MIDDPNLPSSVYAERTHLQLPSLPRWVEPAAEFLRHKAVLTGVCHEARSNKLLLALHEALTNAVVHGNLGVASELKERDDDSFARTLAERAADPAFNQRMVDVLVDYDGERCRWTITDQGDGFDVKKVFAQLESDDPELLLASGRGILIMRSFLDEVKYEAGGRRVILTLNRPSGEEKRREQRIDINQPVQVAPIRANGTVDWDAAYQAVSVNLSEQGIGLLQKQLAASDRVLIGIFAGAQPIYLPAEVRHCQALGDNVVELGCRFQAKTEVAPATEACLPPQSDRENAVQHAVDSLLKQRGELARTEERRLHPRLAFNERIEILRPGEKKSIVAYARDLSKGGIAFVTTAALRTQVIVVSVPRPPATPLRLRARVVRCRKVQDGFYEVGAMFLNVEK